MPAQLRLAQSQSDLADWDAPLCDARYQSPRPWPRLADSLSAGVRPESKSWSSAPCAATNVCASGILARPVRLRLTVAAHASGAAWRGTLPAIAPGHCAAPFVLPLANQRLI
ncbi:unnamed protein product [Euphydryas editha]|uniref:Uncharacterized protein n=1 Tax=Euphydryas editha TaxID=104508 RepID=A0AAU9U1A0_EUPED|nr:unnamed protein product [Euphydryas editha]